jgi:hypothetical protein
MQASDLKCWRFRFTDPADVERFGDDWIVWDEEPPLRLPARALAQLEAELGVRLGRVVALARINDTMANLAAIWLSIRAKDPDVAGPYDDFDVQVYFTEWEELPVEEAETAAPLDLTPSPDSPPSPPAE